MHRFSLYLWYPLLLGSAVGLFVLLRTMDASLLATTYVPILVTGAALVALEWARPARASWRPARDEVWGDALYMLGVQIFIPRALMLLVGIGLGTDGVVRAGLDGWPSAWPYAAQVLLMLIAADFMRYWLHRACHRWMPLWRLHEVHHAPERLYALNVGRFHPLEKSCQYAVDTMPFVLLGVSAEVIGGYYLLYAVNGLFQHANVRVRHGWANYLVGSAETHRWHHVRDVKGGNCNFGATLILWDLLFGTFYLPRALPHRIGITDTSYPRGLLAQWLRPFQAVLARGILGRVLLKSALRWVLLVEGLRLGRDTLDPMRRQRAVLARIIEANRDTSFGRLHRFDDVGDYTAFAAHVPVCTYEDLRPFIEEEIRSGAQALTRERPVRFVQTSGTTGQPKLVPITDTVMRHSARMQRFAAALQYRACSRAFDGAILAIVGAADEKHLTDGRIVGAASGVLAGHTHWLLRERFVLPPTVASIGDATLKYLVVLRLALARRDVSLCVTANATTLLVLLRLYREHHAVLIDDLRHGTFFREADLSQDVVAELAPRLRADPRRAAELVCLGAAANLGELWPLLAAVATWTSGSAAIALGRLRQSLAPGCRILELGYLASEFRATLTLGRRAGSGLPTLDSNFFEFAERQAWERGERALVTLDGLRKGVDYYIVVTTPGGLYRYFINDVVRVTGLIGRTPLLRFVQKGRGVTNLTGEKLYEAQVLEAVKGVATDAGFEIVFALTLADEETCRYDVYLETDASMRPDCASVSAALDTALKQMNVEYADKRAGDRLHAPRVWWLRAGSYEALRAWSCERGQREAQFKVVSLDYRARFAFDIDACVATEEAP